MDDATDRATPAKAPAKARVAVVDDDPRMRALLDQELSDMGVEPYLCPDGDCLLEMAQSDPVELVLLDLMMPGTDGIACLERLREIGYPGTVVIFTALNDDGKRREAMAAGAIEYLLKPDLIQNLPRLIDLYVTAKSG